MVLMPLQHVPDIDYEPSPLRMSSLQVSELDVDLSFSVLRSMSSMCNRFYRNMEIRSRLLLSISSQGQLWGFFNMIHSRPRFIRYADRLAFQSFAMIAGQILLEKEKAEEYQAILAAKQEIATIISLLNKEIPVVAVLKDLPPRLMEILDISGVMLCMNNQIIDAGKTPPKAYVKDLLVWLKQQDAFFMTDQLPNLFEPALAYRELATGLIVLCLDSNEYLIMMRPEWIYEVSWAGNIQKPIEIDAINGERRLTPRGSFETWKEIVRGKARPWQIAEIDALKDLHNALQNAIKQENLIKLTEALARTNADLESFAYIVSHDLQQPLRGISNFAQFLSEAVENQLGSKPIGWINSIIKLSARMTQQVEALLNYARANQTPAEFKPVNLQDLIKILLEDLYSFLNESEAKISLPRDLPCVICDPIRTLAVFENLVTNALKYNDHTEKQVEIGFIEVPELTFYVKDNGIGIPSNHFQNIFTIFRRLHGNNEYGGGHGAGLAIVRKHIEKQEGTIWLTSKVGEGSTFFFTLNPIGNFTHIQTDHKSSSA